MVNVTATSASLLSGQRTICPSQGKHLLIVAEVCQHYYWQYKMLCFQVETHVPNTDTPYVPFLSLI
jgi:hypothetical protein